MNKLEQAARQALEALIKANHFHDYEDEITALREALAQPQVEWVDLTDDEIDEAYDAATKSFRRHQSRIGGQQITAQDNPDWHFASAVIAKFKEKQL